MKPFIQRIKCYFSVSLVMLVVALSTLANGEDERIAATDLLANVSISDNSVKEEADLALSSESEEVQLLNNKTITDIDIQGIKDDTQKSNAVVFLGLEQVKNEKITQPLYVDYLIRNGVKEIARSQQPFGYYNATVTVSRKMQDHDTLKIVYQVQLGPQTKVRTQNIQLTGKALSNPDFLKVIHEVPFRIGDAFNHEKYESYKERLETLAADQGYFDGLFNTKYVEVNTDENTADIRLHYDSGPRYVFGDVSFVQGALAEKIKDGDEKSGIETDPNATDILSNQAVSTKTEESQESSKPLPLDTDFLARFVEFSPNDAYNAALLTKLQQDLQATNYFRQVLVSGNPDKTTKTVPVEAQLIMNKKNRYVFGLGYSTDTGIRGKVDFNRRWVNRRGHTFSSHIYASLKDSEFDNIYTIPAARPTTDYYYFQLGGRFKRDDYDIRRVFGETGYVWRRGHWNYRIAGTSAFEKFAIGNDRGKIFLTYPQIKVTYTSADNRLNPDSGFQLQGQLLGGIKRIGSDTSFLQTNFKARYVQALGEKRRLIARFDGGATWVDNFHRLPPSFRYFTGGDKSIRGYAYEKIGDYDSSNTNIGGKYFAVGGLEYEQYVWNDFALAAFVDVGDAFSKKFSPKIGAGLGVHWRSPVGPIKVDIGHGFDKKYADKVRLHVTVGTELDL